MRNNFDAANWRMSFVMTTRNIFGMNGGDYVQIECAVLTKKQRAWLETLRRKIFSMYYTRETGHIDHQSEEVHCEKIGLPFILYQRTGKCAEYVHALRTWVHHMERKHLLERLGA